MIKVEGFIDEYGNFKVDMRKDREPVKFLAEWGAASGPGGHGDHSSQRVLTCWSFVRSISRTE